MISILQAQDLLDQHSNALPPEFLPLGQVHGRVLREAVATSEDLPPFDRSAMDGYAVLKDDSADQFEVVGQIQAGDVTDRELTPGQAIRIFTGARLPGPGLRVVMQEHVEAG